MRRFLKSVTGSSMFDDDDETRTEDVVVVQHGKDALKITFPKGDIDASTTTVKDLRIAVQDALGLDHDHSIKLVYAGHNLKDDDAALSLYKLRHGVKVLCMASKSRLASAPSASSSKGQPGLRQQPKPKVIPPLEKIELVRKLITGTVLPLVEAFEANPPEEPDRRKDEHHRLSETVLSEMLKLDSVDVDGEDGLEVRKKRKEMVKQLHAILERLDKVGKAT